MMNFNETICEVEAAEATVLKVVISHGFVPYDAA